VRKGELELAVHLPGVWLSPMGLEGSNSTWLVCQQNLGGLLSGHTGG
jgi:hypothetical protein